MSNIKIAPATKPISVTLDGLTNSEAGFMALLASAYRVDQLKNTGKSAGEGLSGLVLELAGKFEDCEAFKRVLELAENAVRGMDEKAFKARFGMEPVRNKKGDANVLPACWSQYKSNILIGWGKFGLCPRDFETEKAFRNALNEARKADKADTMDPVLKKLATIADQYKAITDPDAKAIFSEQLDNLLAAAKLAASIIAEVEALPEEHAFFANEA